MSGIPCLAAPVFHDGRVYIASGQTPEHGEGPGRLVCIDPSKNGDISSELAVDAEGDPLPHRRIQAVDPAQGERVIANPNSGLVWDYTKFDRDGNGWCFPRRPKSDELMTRPRKEYKLGEAKGVVTIKCPSFLASPTVLPYIDNDPDIADEGSPGDTRGTE
ncbi:MAG TPA: hypothetical protein VMM76_17570 [Pirellulaceae bacterium]|nr:hypothetical protein [Pirellulaceae bacterium]